MTDYEYDPEVEELEDGIIRTAKPASLPYTDDQGLQDDAPEEDPESPDGDVVPPDNPEATDA